jgi:SAM-dependent methyltransferase
MSSATFKLHDHPAHEPAEVADFNRLASLYRWMEWITFGPFLWKCRCAFLSEIKNRKSALILGDGDGRFTARLLNHNPHISVDAVDASDAMLRSLRRLAGRNALRIRTRLADARLLNLPTTANFDLVVTHFFLDCLITAEVASLATRLRERMLPGAAWLVSEFAVPDTPFGRFIAAPLVSALYLAFRLLTGLRIRRLPDHPKALRAAGFVLSKQRKFLRGLLVSEIWEPIPIQIDTTAKSK